MKQAIIRIIKSSDNSGLLIDCTTEALEHEIKNKKVRFLLL